ncbi:helix-turn-helix domain-containing protein [Streptomyces sp. NPDC051561]|uniref:helix-turn-helix domain-containing protein n=1 Tax=Streptomyces sp. NPDC051561 TaxID=3365658 RepID=UPI00378D295F
MVGAPHPRLRPAVLGYRGFRLDLGAPRRRLELPVGAVTLLLAFEEPVTLLRPGGAAPDPVPRTLTSCVSGLSTGPVIGMHGGRIAGVEVQIAPWAAYGWFGVALHELADRSVGPGALPRRQGCRVAELAGLLSGLSGWSERFRVLDATLGRWAEDGPVASARTVGAWRELVRSGGSMPVRRLADHVGWSPRQLEKRFREEIGLRPKAAARVLRLQRARRLLAAGRPAAETAAICGFYDQAHLGGEFKALTGCTPGDFTLLRRLQRGASSDALADRLAGEVTSLLLAPASATDSPAANSPAPGSPAADSPAADSASGSSLGHPSG